MWKLILDQRAQLPSILGRKQQNIRDCCLHRTRADCRHEYKVWERFSADYETHQIVRLRLSCTDSSVAKAISAVILEKYTWGSLGPVPPTWAVYASDDQGVYSETERTIQNVMFRGRK